MKLTVLIDLDDTLLTNDMDIFLKAYLKALGKAFSPHVAPEKMIPQLLSATSLMTRKTSPMLKLEEVFDLNFYPGLGLDKKEVAETINNFYREEFPKIQSVTSPRQEAVELMGRMLSEGWDVIIATNPLFPHTAVWQRAQWAGLTQHLTEIKAITSYDHYHFSKPNPAYFAEILGQFGWPNQPAAMIGNTLSDDILPAARLGLPVYWLNDNKQPLPESLAGTGECGSMEGIFPWLKSIAERGLPLETKDPEGLMAVLASTPAALDTMIGALSPTQWKARPAEKEWSPTEIICHLRDVDREVNLPRFEILLKEENPFLPAVETDPWAVERDYQSQDGGGALMVFMANRIKLLEMLAGLPASAWAKNARHAIFGPTTLQELVAIVISHDQTHLNQMLRAVNV